MSFNYAITIKYIGNSDLNQIDESSHQLKLLSYIEKQKGIYVSHSFERDSKDRLHLHGHFMARKGIRYNLYKCRGWHIHVDPLPTTDDVKRWTDYMYKDSESANAILQYMRDGNYAFIDPAK